MWRRSRPAVPESMVAEVEAALARTAAARERLAETVASGAGLRARRRAHADLREAYTAADVLLRGATRLARAHSHGEWSRWRRRLSALSTARQQHLLQEADDSGVLLAGSVRAIDSGMSGPDLGELQHGKAGPAGKPATYGLDLDATLLALEEDVPHSVPPAPRRPEHPEVPDAHRTGHRSRPRHRAGHHRAAA